MIKTHLPAVWRPLRAPGRIATALCAVALLAAGCGASSGSSASGNTGTAQHPVTITVWDWVNSSQAISLFEKSHPGIKVKLDHRPGGRADLRQDVRGDQGRQRSRRRAGRAATRCLSSSPPAACSTSVTTARITLKNQFVGWAWNQVSFDGGVYALPLSASPIGYHFNMTLLKKYGIDTVPTTYAQLAADAKIYHQRNPSGYLIGVPPRQQLPGHADLAGRRAAGSPRRATPGRSVSPARRAIWWPTTCRAWSTAEMRSPT